MRRVIVAILLGLLSFATAGEEVFYKGQKRSLVKWQTIDPMKWTDLALWKREKYIKENIPNYYQFLQDTSLKESIGKVLQCVGNCFVENGDGSSRAMHRSRFVEGEDVTTGAESYMWIFLFDGTMVRLSPNSSITVKEINIGEESNFIHARINYGNVLWLSRSEHQYKSDSKRETDQLFLPLDLYDANQASRKAEFSEDDLFAYLDPSSGTTPQFERLNKLVPKGNKLTLSKKTKTLLVAPNGSIYGENPTVEFIVLVGEKTYLKQRSFNSMNISTDEPPPLVEFSFRGFENKRVKSLELDTWYEVSDTGRLITPMTLEEYRPFAMGEFVTKRIPTILIAREIWLQKYSKFAFQKISKRDLARHFGYRLWTKFRDSDSTEIDLRLKYLKEYTRRLETTNILASLKLKSQFLAADDEIRGSRYSNSFYNRSIRAYYRRGDARSGDMVDSADLNSTKRELWKRLNAIK